MNILEDDSSLTPGNLVGDCRYFLDREIRRDCLGVVWSAEDQRLGVRVWLRFIPTAIAKNFAVMEALRKDIVRAIRVAHPGFLQVSDLFVSADELPFIAMEHSGSSNLAELLSASASGHLSWEFVQPILGEIGTALVQVHQEGSVHGNLQPASVFLDETGRVKIAELGVAQALKTAAAEVGLALDERTLAYCPPESLDGGEASDVYSMGALAYELLTGRPAFHGDDIQQQVLTAMPPDLNHRTWELGLETAHPAPANELVLSCLEKNPSLRPDLQLAMTVQQEPENEPREPPKQSETFESGPSRRTSAWGLVGIAILVLTFATAVYWKFMPERATGIESIASLPKPKPKPQPVPFSREPVEVENVKLLALTNGAPLFQGRRDSWANVLPELKGHVFTQHEHSTSHTVHFRVNRDGWVHLAATFRSMEFQDGSKDTTYFVSQEGLQRQGWRPHVGIARFMDWEKEWVLYSRWCRAGEKFSYQTEHYHAPIVIFDPKWQFLSTNAPFALSDLRSTSKFAEVIVEHAHRKRLRPGEKVFTWTIRPSDRWLEVPPRLQNMIFSRPWGPRNQIVKFEVLRSGQVYLAVTERSARAALDRSAKPHFITLAELTATGWKRESSVGTLRDETHRWIVFSRSCKKGERFTYQTEETQPPVVLTR